ncbi:MAG: phasin family protein [Alphaproteobacteria bacterium]|nr:phasin family protein [Alphaproteobacteria bacterium]TAD86892.1 MAG: phasin family protein [Alphaproteobacteria bacterium]
MPATMSNPFFDMDLSKLMADFKVPGVDIESILATQRKNVEALAQANQLAVEGMQAVARRQAEILRTSLEEATKAAQEMMEQGAPEEKMAKQTELVKVAFEKALSNMRELAEMVAKSNTDAFNVINKRFTESLDEMRGMMTKKPAKK